jgi:hypothetical protein
MVKYHIKCHISDMFRSIFIILRELLNIHKAHIKIQMDYIKYIKICT